MLSSRPLYMETALEHMHELQSLVAKGTWAEEDSMNFAELLCHNIIRMLESGLLDGEQFQGLMRRLQCVIDKGSWKQGESCNCNSLARLLCKHVNLIVFKYVEVEPVLEPGRVLVEPAAPAEPERDLVPGQSANRPQRVSGTGKEIAFTSSGCLTKHRKVAEASKKINRKNHGQKTVRKVIEREETEKEDLRLITEDDFKWKKYGKKKRGKYHRSYSACAGPDCPVKKLANRFNDHQIEVIYIGDHNCKHNGATPDKNKQNTEATKKIGKQKGKMVQCDGAVIQEEMSSKLNFGTQQQQQRESTSQPQQSDRPSNVTRSVLLQMQQGDGISQVHDGAGQNIEQSNINQQQQQGLMVSTQQYCGCSTSNHVMIGVTQPSFAHSDSEMQAEVSSRTNFLDSNNNQQQQQPVMGSSEEVGSRHRTTSEAQYVHRIGATRSEGGAIIYEQYNKGVPSNVCSQQQLGMAISSEHFQNQNLQMLHSKGHCGEENLESSDDIMHHLWGFHNDQNDPQDFQTYTESYSHSLDFP